MKTEHGSAKFMINVTQRKSLSMFKSMKFATACALILLIGWFASAIAQDTRAPVLINVTPQEAARLIRENSDIIILDVRTPVEFYVSHIENAININYYSFSFRSKLKKLDRSKTYLVHCQTGVRSGKTLPMMVEAGFTSIYHIEDGFKAWKEANLPTT